TGRPMVKQVVETDGKVEKVPPKFSAYYRAKTIEFPPTSADLARVLMSTTEIQTVCSGFIPSLPPDQWSEIIVKDDWGLLGIPKDRWDLVLKRQSEIMTRPPGAAAVLLDADDPGKLPGMTAEQRDTVDAQGGIGCCVLAKLEEVLGPGVPVLWHPSASAEI